MRDSTPSMVSSGCVSAFTSEIGSDGDSQPAGGCAVSEHGGIPDAAITEVENAIIIAVNLIFILLGDIEFGNIPARCARIVAVYVIRIIGDKFKITVFPDFDR